MNLRLVFDNIQDFNGVPSLDIRINSVSVYRGPVQSEIHVDDTNTPSNDHVMLEIEHFGKDYQLDTLTVNNEIVKDKNCNLAEIYVDGHDLQELKWHSMFTTDQGQVIDNCLFFGPNGTWSMQFQLPILPWILSERHKVTGSDPYWQEDYQYYINACHLLQTLN